MQCFVGDGCVGTEFTVIAGFDIEQVALGNLNQNHRIVWNDGFQDHVKAVFGFGDKIVAQMIGEYRGGDFRLFFQRENC